MKLDKFTQIIVNSIKNANMSNSDVYFILNDEEIELKSITQNDILSNIKFIFKKRINLKLNKENENESDSKS